jgi:hypothetical protein
VSDFPVFVPPFVRPSDRADGPVFAARDCEYDADEALDVEGDDLDATEETPAPREGLPPSFRTRHEPHYVEALLSPAAVGARGPARGPAVALPGVASALPVIAEALESIRAALGDLPMPGRPLRERVALELARAEALRASWLAEAATVLQAAPVIALDEVDLASVLRSVADALGPEHRLTGTSPSIYVPEGRFPVRGDERLLTLAVGAALAAMRTLVEDRADPSRLVVRLAPRQDGTVRTVEVSQAAVRLPSPAYASFFDTGCADHPAGQAGALLLAAARRIATVHGGSLEVSALDGGGCRLSLSIPAGA